MLFFLLFFKYTHTKIPLLKVMQTLRYTRTPTHNCALSLIRPGHLLESPVTADGCCVSRLALSKPEIPQCDPTAY